jgi:pSer/pThr/pTyr-binding forkhead associated (FHA) protein
VIGRGDAVGRAGGLDLAPFDSSRVVSRNHAELSRTDSGWVCRDLGATNGTFINGRRIAPGSEVPVAPGDQLAFANVALIVEGLTAWATS